MTQTLSTQNAEAVRDFASSIQGDVRRYSGRGMYGQECLGIDGDFDRDDFAFRIGAHPFLGRVLGKPRFDQMGKGIIAYWPGIAPLPR